MKKYDQYKNSGVEWLGEIPEHWEVNKLKNSIKKIIDNRGRTPLFGDIGTPMLEVRNITNGLKNPTDDFEKFVLPEIVIKYEREKVVINDVLISTVGATSGKVVIIEKMPTYFIAQNVVGLRFIKEINTKFMYFFLSSEYFKTSLQIINKGNTIDNLKVSIFINNVCFIPPLSEQTAIANFLDDKTSKIEQAIAIKQQQIELLKESRQILIHKAVTRGLKDNVKLKDSGVEWIGEIPEHWEVKKLKYCLNINNGSDYKHIQTEEGYPVIGSGGQFAFASEYMYDGEVIFLGRKGTIDKPLYFEGKFWAVDTMFYAIAKSNSLTKYLYYVSTTIPFKLYSTSTALPSMTQSDLNNHKIILPSVKEQNEIVEYIESTTIKIDTAISIKEQEIEKLKEYKMSLIDGVVTGKVKVC